jgi:glycosyltransferase involved in cell wall biosynthesis
VAPPRIRILHIVQSLGYGGMESRIARLARGLDRTLHQVDILSLRPASAGQVELPPGTKHIYFPIPSGLHPMHLLRLARLIRKGGYDIVHTHNWSSMFYGIAAARLALKPIVVHGEHGLNRSDLDGVPPKRLLAQRLLARMADWIVPVNAVISAHVRKTWNLDGKKLTVIPNGVDLIRFRPAPAPAEGFVLGMVGRLDDVKDIGTPLRALRLLNDRGNGSGLKLMLIGDGPMKTALETQARDLGIAAQVEFLGARRDVEAWYGRFHLYLNTSVYEGMCNTVLEAMACGLPLVVSSVPGNEAWIKSDNARFFPAGNPEELAARIADLMLKAEERVAMGSRNRARVEAEYDNNRFLETYAGLYRDLTGKKKG